MTCASGTVMESTTHEHEPPGTDVRQAFALGAFSVGARRRRARRRPRTATSGYGFTPGMARASGLRALLMGPGKDDRRVHDAPARPRSMPVLGVGGVFLLGEGESPASHEEVGEARESFMVDPSSLRVLLLATGRSLAALLQGPGLGPGCATGDRKCNDMPGRTKCRANCVLGRGGAGLHPCRCART